MPLKDKKTIPPKPWHSFLKELDALAIGIVDFQCLGAFVVTQLYGLERSTGDLDVLSIAPIDQRKDFLEKAGMGSALHKRYKIYLDYVGVASIPYEYQSRLIEMYPGAYGHIRLFALDPYDIALSKLCAISLVTEKMCAISQNKSRSTCSFCENVTQTNFGLICLGIPENQDAILNLWIEIIEQDRQSDMENQ